MPVFWFIVQAGLGLFVFGLLMLLLWLIVLYAWGAIREPRN